MTAEPIEPGGALAPGPCGRPHLVGPVWSWWRCRTCAALRRYRSTVALREQAAALADFMYADPFDPDACGMPTYGASYKRHRRRGEDCPSCCAQASVEKRAAAEQRLGVPA